MITAVLTLPYSKQSEQFVLRALSGDDWMAFKAIRLEALELVSNVFAASYEQERALSEAAWRERATPRPDHSWFGVFHNGQLVGITQALTWPGDPSGRTALFRSSYVIPEFRGEGIAGLLCEVRQEWARKNPAFTSAMLFHREGHWIAKVVLAFGAVYSHTEMMTFADGTSGPALWYRKQLQP